MDTISQVEQWAAARSQAVAVEDTNNTDWPLRIRLVVQSRFLRRGASTAFETSPWTAWYSSRSPGRRPRPAAVTEKRLHRALSPLRKFRTSRTSVAQSGKQLFRVSLSVFFSRPFPAAGVKKRRWPRQGLTYRRSDGA